MVVCCVLVLLLGTVGANGRKKRKRQRIQRHLIRTKKKNFGSVGGVVTAATKQHWKQSTHSWRSTQYYGESRIWCLDGWTEKCAIQLSGGTAPDVMQINWNWMYQFSADGSKFADLRNYADILHLENYDQATLDQGMVAGKMHPFL